MLSQNTTDVNSKRAFAALKEAFPQWEDVRQAPDGGGSPCRASLLGSDYQFNRVDHRQSCALNCVTCTGYQGHAEVAQHQHNMLDRLEMSMTITPQEMS